MVDYGTVRDGSLLASTVNSDGIPIDMEPKTALLLPNHYTTRALVRDLQVPQASPEARMPGGVPSTQNDARSTMNRSTKTGAGRDVAAMAAMV